VLLYQPKEGYRFNSDTHFLYHFIAQFRPRGEVLDIGSGSGILGLLIARDFCVNLHMVERERRAYRYSCINAHIHRVNAQIEQCDFLEYESRSKFDLIVSNPPFYLDSVIKSTNHSLKSSRYAAELPFDRMVVKINTLIKPKGEFIFCYDAKQLTQVASVLEEKKLTISDIRFVHPKINKESNLMLVRAKKSSRSPLKVHPPLIIHEGEAFSEEVKGIYKHSSTHSITSEVDDDNERGF
jgi:tRNA1(Val) A37 N6-methylase TrmN6